MFAQKDSPCSTLEVYDKTLTFIPVDIMEDMVELVSQFFRGVQALVVWNRKLYKGGF